MVHVVAFMRRDTVMMVLERLGHSSGRSTEQHAARRVALEGHGDKQQAGDDGAQDAIHAASLSE
jgi:hypothetical protein